MSATMFSIIDISDSVYGLKGTVTVGNVYKDNLGFGELWVITKIKKNKIHLVSITHSWQPEVVTDYNKGFMYRFDRYRIKKEV